MGTITGTNVGEPLNGTPDADTINALGGNDIVDGGDGNDIINGGTGGDQLSGGNGDDLFIEDQITDFGDTFNGGAGIDTIELRIVPSPIPLAIGLLSPHNFTASNALTSIERMVFASGGGYVQAGILLSSIGPSGLTELVAGPGRDSVTFQTGSTSGSFTMPTLTYTGWAAGPTNAWDAVDDSIVLASAALSGTNTTLSAAAGISVFQVLVGQAGNDTLNGSNNADSLIGGGGTNQLFGNGGNDLLSITNTAAPNGTGGFNAPSTFDGLGSTFDGGSGTDALGIGGLVNLKATLVSIEGVYLFPGFIPTTNNVAMQQAARLVLDSQHLAMLPSNAFFSGTGTVEIALADNASFNAGQFVITSGATVTFNLIAGDGNGVSIAGSAGSDIIELGVGNQTMNGGAGDDILVFGEGIQTATGGTGADRFTVAVGSGTVTDFTLGTDKVDLSDSGITTLSRFNDLNITQVGADLVAGADTMGVHFELRLQNVAKASFTANEVLLGTDSGINNETGSAFADLLYGFEMGDELHGNGGNDRLYSGGGVDKLYGDDGDDVLILDGFIGGFGVTYDGGAGTDTLLLRNYDVNGTSSYGLFGTVTGLEKLQFDSHTGETMGAVVLWNSVAGGMNQVIGGDGTDTLTVAVQTGGTYDLTGLGLSNWSSNDTLALAAPGTLTFSVTLNARSDVAKQILIGGQGSDILNGSSFGDVLNGGAGADQLHGGLGDDTYIVSQEDDVIFEGVGEGTDSVTANTNFYLYANVENLTLGDVGDVYGVGNDLANVLTGNGGQNLLIGWGGDDEIHGGGARDALFGVDGNDRLYGDAGIDYIVAGAGDDVVDGGADADEIYGQDGNDTLTGGGDFSTDILVGGAGNDVIHGDSGLGDYDLMYGNEGDDSFYVDTPADLVFEQAGEGHDTVYAGITGGGYYLYANIEDLVLTGNTPFGVGNALDNRLTGSALANWLLGGAGNDTLNGKGGNDVLFGEAGADIFVFEAGTGGDVIGDFTPGTDKIDLKTLGLSWTQVQAAMGENGGTSFLNLGGSDFIVLNGVAMANLHQADFILV